MTRRWLLATVFLCLATVATPLPARATLVDRARSALADRPTTPERMEDHEERLLAYADSLRAQDEIGLAARCLEVAGIGAYRRNALDLALERWQRGVDLARTEGSPRTESSLLNALAIGHTVSGDVEAALPVYERSLELRTSLADTVGLSRTWGNLANAYANIGRNAEALEATAREEHWLAFTDNHTGRLANALRRAQLLNQFGRPTEALVWAERALAMVDDHELEEHRGIACMRMGDVLLDLRRFDRAAPWLERARDLARANGDRYTASYAEQMRIVALLESGRADEALDAVPPLIDEVRTAGNDPLLTVLRRLEGHALFALGRVDEAEAALRTALDLFEARRSELVDERSRAGIFAASGEVYAALARCLLERGDVEAAFDVVERGRAPLFRERVDQDVPDRDRLQTILAEHDGALVLFNDSRSDPLVAFVLTADTLVAVEVGPVHEPAADARAALRLLAAGESIETCAPILERLERQILWPLLEAIPTDTRRVLLVPPSSLAGFPFGLLRDREGMEWTDRVALGYLPNAASLLALAARAPADGPLVALADPDFPRGVAPGPLPESPGRARAGVPLPEARKEVRTIGDPSSVVAVGGAATAAMLRDDVTRDAAVLHLATHAVVDPVDGRRSALVLADDEGPAVVEALEVDGLQLSNDLVVLSGCSTFGDHRVLGEGWFGLPRAFLGAGSRSVISTLWDVDDVGARRFVEHLYEGLRAGLPRDEALARARRRARAEGLPPREWAAFVLTGPGHEPVAALAGTGPAGNGAPSAPWIALGLVLLALRGLVVRRPAD